MKAEKHSVVNEIDLNEALDCSGSIKIIGQTRRLSLTDRILKWMDEYTRAARDKIRLDLERYHRNSIDKKTESI
jgi:hypothetical protein